LSTRAVRACFGTGILALTALYYAFPGGQLYSWAVLGYTAVAAMLVGVRLHRPARRLPWYLLCAGVACTITGDTWFNLVLLSGREPAFPGPADVLYLLGYPLLTGGLLLFARARSGGGADRAALLDALVPTVGLGLVAWVYWIAPFTRSEDLSTLEKVVSIAYPLGDVLVLAMIIRMLSGSGRRTGAVSTIGIGVVGLLVADIFYGQSQLNSDWNIGSAVDLGWAVFYAAMGYAALQPSMRMISEPTGHIPTGMGRHRLFWLTTAALIAPAVLVVEYVHDRNGVVDAPVIAAAAAVMFLLVLGRVADLALAQRQAGNRERALREAGATLFAAATTEDVAAAIRHAVAKIMPADQPYQLLTPRPLPGEAEVAVRMTAAADLPHGLHAGGFTHALYATQPLPGGGYAVMVIGAPEAVLHTVLPSFDALGSQIAVVLDRIALTAEVSRRDSEAYFRTLIQSAADVILILDDDGTIRYASPSAGTLFGGGDPTGSPFADLIAADSQEALREVLVRAGCGGGDLDGFALAAERDGRRVEIECDLRDLREDPTVRGLVITLRDVTERRRLLEDLTHQAFHDALTGLANRVLFRNRLEQAFSVASRDGATLGVLLVDLDDFKEVNDTLGHAVGDQLLLTVAQRISAIIGAGSTAARMGGDEFAVLVEQSNSADAAEDVAALLVAALSEPVEVTDAAGNVHQVSGAASVGVATSRRLPFALLAHRTHAGGVALDRHPVHHPHPSLHRLPHPRLPSAVP
jgi:diguanylate cyclase (GGDEF)-like protein/PAS domain S-box-containing protein